MSVSATNTRWVKTGKFHDFVFLGKDVIATASGIYVTFLNLSTAEERIERFDNQERGDGASCLAGHPAVPIFSTVERRASPKISLFTYPAIEKISHCVSDKKCNGLLSCAFAGTDYILSLTNFPDYRVVVWFWRTGDKMVEINSPIEENVQSITCSPNSPYVISQFAENTGKACVYQMHVCSKIVSLLPVDLNVLENRLSSFSWSSDGNAFLCDDSCNVWWMSMDATSTCCVLKAEEHATNNETSTTTRQKPMVVAFRNGVIVVDRDSRINFCVRSFADSNDSWRVAWSTKAIPHPIRAGRHCQRDGVLFHCGSGHIYEMNVDQRDDEPRFELIYTDGIKFVALSAISTREDHVAAVDQFHRLNVLHVSSGNIVAKLHLKNHGEVISIDSHPRLPLIATGSVAGNCLLICLNSPSKPMILKCFHAHEESLDKIKFSQDGNVLGAATVRNGCLFVISKTSRERGMNIVGLMKTQKQITDFLIYDLENGDITILILIKTYLNRNVGNTIVMYSCKASTNLCHEISCVIELSSAFQTLHYGVTRKTDILGIPFLSKQLHRIRIQNNFQNFCLVDALPTKHQLRNIELSVTQCHVVSFGHDGLIVLRNGSALHRIIALFVPHHRSEAGVKYAIVANEEMVVSLGKNGDIVCTKLSNLDSTTKMVENAESASVDSSHLRELICGLTNEHDGSYEENANGTWIENVAIASAEREQIQARAARDSVIKDFEKLRNDVRRLLDENENAEDEARLSIANFDLDREFREEKIALAKIERDELEQDIVNRIARQDQVSAYLRETFWQPMMVHACELTSMFGQTKVTNYPLPFVPQRVDDFLFSEQFSFETSKFAPSGTDDHSLTKDVAAEALIPEENDEVFGNTPSDSNEELSLLSGTTTHRWITEKNLYSHQECSQSTNLANNVIETDAETELKIQFNELFENMRSLKADEMAAAVRHIDKIRHCAVELEQTFGLKCSVEPAEYPRWRSTETPENIVTVKDEEVTARSPRSSREDGEDNEGALAKEKSISDDEDFRATALEQIMNGVLEVRWEDEIKKDITKPICLAAKHPSQYTEADISAIRSYEAKVQELEAQRQKYKLMLETELDQAKESLRSSVERFEARLRAFRLKKIRVDSAILREKLKRLRETRNDRQRQLKTREVSRFAERVLAPASREARRLTSTCDDLETATLELKSRYETVARRDKLLESKFRAEFGDLKQPMLEHLLRHYKRRPRVGWLTCTSVVHLAELGRCLANNERSPLLPRDCLEFLRGMNMLDAMPAGLPPQIDLAHWRTMCRLRRLKAESETKVKSCAVELAEAEHSHSFYHKLSVAGQSKLHQLRSRLEGLRKSLDDWAESEDVQVVLKMEQIEIPLRGCRADFESALVVRKDELVRVNEEINKAGRKKLAAIRRGIDCRKTIACEEWRHRCTRTTLDDLREELQDVRATKISKDVREYLERHPDTIKAGSVNEDIERVTRIMKDRFHKFIEQENARLEKLSKEKRRWARRNEEATREIEAGRRKNNECESLLRDPRRARDEEFRKKKMATITRRTTLVRRVRENYEDLLVLRAQLEVLKLRTYPTLRFIRKSSDTHPV